jgi:hypothetical protein
MSADRPLMLLALLMAAGLALTPYIHLNDLVLEALPLLVLASRPLGILGRGTLVLWGLSLPINLALAVALFTITGDVNKPWSYGVVLTGGTLLAITVAANRERARDPAAGAGPPQLAPWDRGGELPAGQRHDLALADLADLLELDGDRRPSVLRRRQSCLGRRRCLRPDTGDQ